tara:strand:- start:897 stop:3380 length:2484 start_codon:yes stop_codon:yes gene_type:complete
MPQHSDIVLQNTDGSSNKVELTLWKDSPSVPGGYKLDSLAFLPPRQPTDDANYQQVDPKAAMTYDLTSFHRGFGQGEDKSFGKESRYGYSDGVLAQFNGELTLGYSQEECDFLIRNGRFEDQEIDQWTETNVTVARSTVSSRSGDAHGRVTVGSNNGTLTQSLSSVSSAALDGENVHVIAYAKRVSGSGSCTLSVTGTGTTESTTSSSYEIIEVTGVAASGGTTITLKFSTADDVWDIDDISVIPAGGVSFPAAPVTFEGYCYITCGQMLLYWDESRKTFDCKYFFDRVVSSIITFDEKMLVGSTVKDGSNNYKYFYLTVGGNPASTSLTANTVTSSTAAVAEAKFFVRARNANGNFAVAKVRSNKVTFIKDPYLASPVWGSEIEIGKPESEITNAFAANDTLIIGKEDGMFVYDRNVNQFRDVSPEAGLFSGGNNFKRAIARAGRIYATSGDRAFWSIPFLVQDNQWDDISYLLRATSFVGFGGRVTSLAQDVNNIFVTVADDLKPFTQLFPYTYPFSFSTGGISQKLYLVAIRTQRDSSAAPAEQVAHTITSLDMSDCAQLARYKDETTSTIRSSTFAFGTFANDDTSNSNVDEPRITRLVMPLENEHPSLVGSRQIRTQGDFYTSFMDFNFPDQDKSLAKIAFLTTNVDSDSTVALSYKLDDSSYDDDQGWVSVGTVSSSGSQVLTPSLTDPVTFKRIRFRLRLGTGVRTDRGPRVLSMVVHAMFNPVDFLTWNIQAKLLDARLTARRLRQVTDSQVLSTVLSNIDTLRQEPFILFTDLDGSQYRARITNRTLVPIDRDRRGISSAAVERSYLLSLSLNEVKTS